MKEFEQEMQSMKNDFSDLVFLCIGTDKVIGDSIGPIVGSSLKEIESNTIHVFGDGGKKQHFLNIKNTLENIYSLYSNPFLITIDAALSSKKSKGEIVLEKGYIKIGKALEKSLCFYANINIKCVVGTYHKQKERNIEELTFINQNEIFTIANIVANSIKKVLKKSDIYV